MKKSPPFTGSCGSQLVGVMNPNAPARALEGIYRHETEIILRVKVSGSGREVARAFGYTHGARMSRIGSVSVPKRMLLPGWRWCFLFTAPTGGTITAYSRGDVADLIDCTMLLLQRHFGPRVQLVSTAALELFAVLDREGAEEFARRNEHRYDLSLISKNERKKKLVLCSFSLPVQVGQTDKITFLAVLYQPKNTRTPDHWKLELRPLPVQGACGIKRFPKGDHELGQRRFSPYELYGPVAKRLRELVGDLPIHEKPPIWHGCGLDFAHPVLTDRDRAVLWAIDERIPTVDWNHILCPVLAGVAEGNVRVVLSSSRAKLLRAGLIERVRVTGRETEHRLTRRGERAVILSPTKGETPDRVTFG
ncbi:MAG TPA: hypothetical protein PKW95_22885 [bacterium]|nr:hypothetical protein [bacterium]